MALDRPKLASELVGDVAEGVRLPRRPRVSGILRELQRQGRVKCLTPSLPRGGPGTMWGLTAKGREARKRLCRELRISGVYCQPRINWHSYAWVACGCQKKAIISAMSEQPMRAKEILQEIKKRYRPRTQRGSAEPMGISRQNLNDILQAAVKRGIVMKEVEQRRKGRKPLTRYYLSRTGVKIKQLLVGKGSEGRRLTAR